jgi:cytosine/adenosine deaminase-related metal-dependent hydrolase
MRAFAPLLLLSFVLLGCPPDPKDDTAPPEGDTDTDTDADGDTDADTDTDTDTDTDPGGDWTEGPDLPDCTAQAGDGDLVALVGVVLAPDGPIAGSVVYSQSSGTVACVGEGCDHTGAEVLCTEGVISPGLVDPHNHLQYNLIGPWQHSGLYVDRYDWQSDGDYWDYREAYDEVSDSYNCEVMKWAELRELVSGTTSAIGAYGGSCIDVLIRNLDEDSASHGISGYESYYTASNVTSKWPDPEDGEQYTGYLESGYYDSVLAHVAEGVEGTTTGEIDHMFDIGLAGPGVGFIHATDATTGQLARMAVEGTTIIWSPRSNLDLYAWTTPVDVAQRLGVPVAISMDWTWSGEANPARETGCAWDWYTSRGFGISDVRVWEQATTDAARAVGLDGVLGTLAEGTLADIAVFAYSEQPYRAIIQSQGEDVLLTVIDGQALYGTPDLLEPIASNLDWCEAVEACGEERLICVQSASSGEDAQTYQELEDTLRQALDEVSMPSDLAYAKELFPVFICEDTDTRDSCNLAETSAGDRDGDGIDDADDGCPDAWDPEQRDWDDDGVNDACDPCPLAPDAQSCDHDPQDIDGDGYDNDADDCPYNHDPDQADGDGDGHGDACDPCPEDSNPGDSGCPVTLRQLADESDPNHPAEDSAVVVPDLVVTAVTSAGFYVQDPSEADYGGCYVYLATTPSVSAGDEVTITGTYMEYYGLCEVAYGTVEVTGDLDLPEPITVSACDIGTSGADGERYEGMLMRVEGVTVTSSNPDGSDDFGELEVDSCLRVDDQLFADLAEPDETGWSYRDLGQGYASITGVLTYAYSNFKLEPRDAEDLVLAAR